MQCVILAGGFGTRMKSFTDKIPKSLIPIAGRPFLDYQLEFLAQMGVSNLLLCIGYHGGMIRDFVASKKQWKGRVDFVDEKENLLGTAGAVRLAFDHGQLEPSFAVMYGDSYLPIDLIAVARFFEECGAAALMTVFRNESRFDKSNVCFDGTHVTLYEKNSPHPSADMTYIDSGLSLLKRELIPEYVPATAVMGLDGLFHALSIRGRLVGYELIERFYEIGSQNGLREFECYIRNRSTDQLR